jgi:hypothetical protein
MLNIDERYSTGTSGHHDITRLKIPMRPNQFQSIQGSRYATGDINQPPKFALQSDIKGILYCRDCPVNIYVEFL